MCDEKYCDAVQIKARVERLLPIADGLRKATNEPRVEMKQIQQTIMA